MDIKSREQVIGKNLRAFTYLLDGLTEHRQLVQACARLEPEVLMPSFCSFLAVAWLNSVYPELAELSLIDHPVKRLERELIAACERWHSRLLELAAQDAYLCELLEHFEESDSEHVLKLAHRQIEWLELQAAR